MRKLKKLFVLTLAFLLTVISPQYNAFANNSVTDVTEDGEKSVDVVVKISSEFSVKIPKKIILSGSTKTADYKVYVKGNISGNATLYVTPDENFVLKQENKNDGSASTEQVKTSWIYTDLFADAYVDTDGIITASNISAGTWKGVMKFTIALKEAVKAVATDGSGNSLNTVATVITGDTKDTLLASMVSDGLITDASEVQMLVDVTADDFTGTATAVFDVSSFANTGDTVAIYHYDETNGWELIDTVVVDADGNATAGFTSFSPVAFVITEYAEAEEEEACEHSYDEGVVTTDPTCTEAGVKTYTCSLCEDTYTEAVEATGHSYTDGACTVCGATEEGIGQ